MKKLLQITLLMSILAAFFSGCRSEADYIEGTVDIEPEKKSAEIDTSVPSDVTDLNAVNFKSGIRLTWTDASDDNIAGYEITWNKPGAINRGAFIEDNAVLVAPGSGSFFVGNLTDGESYTFTVKTIKTSGIKAEGVSVTQVFVAAEYDVLTVSLSVSTTDKTTDPVTVSVNYDVDDDVKVKLYYVKGLSYDANEVIASGTEITDNSFTVKKNGVYTVAAKDNLGRTDRKTVEVKNIVIITDIKVGDILMDDGTYLSVENYQTYDGTAKAVAVCVGFNNMKVPLGLGLIGSNSISSGGDAWGGSKNFEHPGIIVSRTTDLASVPEGSEYYTYTYKETTYYIYGDLEGEDNWSQVCQENPEAESTIAVNYRIFNFAETYGATAGLTGTDYESGWFIPSLSQTLEIARNITTVKASLELCGGTKIGANYFTSSSCPETDCDGQTYSLVTKTWFVSMATGEFRPVDKSSGKYYLAVRYFPQD